VLNSLMFYSYGGGGGGPLLVLKIEHCFQSGDHGAWDLKHRNPTWKTRKCISTRGSWVVVVGSLTDRVYRFGGPY